MDFQKLLSNQTSAFVSPALRQITIDVQKVNGINLGQGVCNLPAPELIFERASTAMLNGNNRYTNPRGLLSLREALAKKLEHFNGIIANPETEILVTCGATGAFEGVCGTLLNPGDEVIIFEPSYPYHVQALNRYQAKIVHLTLTAPNWEIDFEAFKTALTPRTKFVLINTPGNPTGKLFSQSDFDKIAELLDGTNTMLVTDEIYEYMTFDGNRHVSAAAVPSQKDRTITIGGYSKTFAITGWRIGYAVAPPSIAAQMASFLDAVYVCAPAPLQQAVADGIFKFDDAFYSGLCEKYRHKRDMFSEGLKRIGLNPLVPSGAYYMICDYSSRFPDLDSSAFVSKMIAEAGIGAVPSSDFVRDHARAKWVRFCLASEDALLEEALDRLVRLK
ncbi:MAG: pyridoxal phosphate-dependent aminotransferase [Fimbriimonadales bacterium]